MVSVTWSGPVTSAEILKGLYALHGATLGGMAPPLTFHKGKPSPVDCWYWIRIQHGKFTTPYGTAPTAGLTQMARAVRVTARRARKLCTTAAIRPGWRFPAVRWTAIGT